MTNMSQMLMVFIPFVDPSSNKSKGFPSTCKDFHPAVTRIRTGVAAATTQSTNHYTITGMLLLGSRFRCSYISCTNVVNKLQIDLKDLSRKHFFMALFYFQLARAEQINVRAQGTLLTAIPRVSNPEIGKSQIVLSFVSILKSATNSGSRIKVG